MNHFARFKEEFWKVTNVNVVGNFPDSKLDSESLKLTFHRF